MNGEGFCDLSRFCQGEKHEDFCGSPLGEEVWEPYCINYRQIKKVIGSLFKSEEEVYIGAVK